MSLLLFEKIINKTSSDKGSSRFTSPPFLSYFYIVIVSLIFLFSSFFNYVPTISTLSVSLSLFVFFLLTFAVARFRFLYRAGTAFSVPCLAKLCVPSFSVLCRSTCGLALIFSAMLCPCFCATHKHVLVCLYGARHCARAVLVPSYHRESPVGGALFFESMDLEGADDCKV